LSDNRIAGWVKNKGLLSYYKIFRSWNAISFLKLII
jgi:hypothetical protein